MLFLWLHDISFVIGYCFIDVPLSQVRVCSNYVRIQDDVNIVVIRELIHAFDDCRAANLDWSDCAHHACSEVPILQCVHIPYYLD